MRLCICNRHVLKYARVGWVVPQCQAVGRQGGIVVALTLQGQRLIEVVEPLWLQIRATGSSEEAFPESHRTPKILKRVRVGNEESRWPLYQRSDPYYVASNLI